MMENSRNLMFFVDSTASAAAEPADGILADFFSRITVELLHVNSEEDENDDDQAIDSAYNNLTNGVTTTTTTTTVPDMSSSLLDQNDHYKQCLDILRHKNLPVSPKPGSSIPWCPVVYDKILCWPAAAANSTVTLPCPDSHGLDASRFVFKTCGSNGRWAGKSPTDFIDSPYGYTDYTQCLSNEDVYGRKYEIVVPPVDDDFFQLVTTATAGATTTGTIAMSSTTKFTERAAAPFIPHVRAAANLMINDFAELTTSITSSLTIPTYSIGELPIDSNDVIRSVTTSTSSIADSSSPALYNVKHLQMSGLIVSLLALLVLSLALVILRKIKNRVNHIRMHVVLAVMLCLLFSFVRELYIVQYYSQANPPKSVNATLIVLYILAELCKCFLCVWIFIECVHYFLFSVLSGWEQVSLWCYVVPGYSFPSLLTLIWIVKVYFGSASTNSDAAEGFVYFQETNREYWILRSFYLILFAGALLLLLLSATVFRSEKDSSNKCRRHLELVLTILTVVLSVIFIFLPFLTAPCSSPSSTFNGCISCFYIYFFGLFIAIIYTLHQIISPWTEYLIVHPDHKNRLVL